MGKADLRKVLVFVFKISSAWVTLREVQFSFPFPSFPLDYFKVQDLKILLGMISFEIVVASLQHYSLKCIFSRCLIVFEIDKLRLAGARCLFFITRATRSLSNLSYFSFVSQKDSPSLVTLKSGKCGQ